MPGKVIPLRLVVAAGMIKLLLKIKRYCQSCVDLVGVWKRKFETSKLSLSGLSNSSAVRYHKSIRKAQR